MDLGWCDVCLKVKSASVSKQFYTDLGFWRVEGSDEEGWSVMTNGALRLGLFEPQFMSSQFSLNFRGGDIADICLQIRFKGHAFAREHKLINGGGSAAMVDPDGHSIFCDAFPGEAMKVDPIE